MKKIKTTARSLLCSSFIKQLSALLAFALCLSTFSFAQSADPLLETGHGSRLQTTRPSPSEIRIVSYNMRWRSGEDLAGIISLLKTDPEIGQAAIIGLQEADRNKKRSRNTNTARLVAEELGMYYAWAAPPLAEESKEGEEETGVAILSPYQLTDVVRLVLPHEGPGGRRRAGIGASLRIGAHLIRVYSLHSETRISTDKKREQLEAALIDLRNYPRVTSVVVMGDFNTLEPQAIQNTTQLFTEAGFETPFPNHMKTWKTLFIELKLDWIWLRGLRPSDYGVDRKVRYSDHFPLWVRVNLDGKAPAGKADIEGRIKKITRATDSGSGQSPGTILIEGSSDDSPRFDKAVVRVTSSTAINLVNGRERKQPLSFEELRVGDRVSARFTPGPVLMSYPVQATAAEITIRR
ncbi:MAG TPA: endonuclease/exonuclease/phosphatase family protein [Pyrinomonadaceae bacterium]|nr:endonuclease/exonuclease/phosphatase family protein [Pyrinomonadaceae bacterium]